MQRSHKIRLRPTKPQETALRKAVGTARYAYNWGLAKWNEQYPLYKEGLAERPDAYKLSNLWTVEKPEWANESPRTAASRAIMNLGKAWISFWNKTTTGAPKFKCKGKARDSFYVDNSHFKIHGNRISLPKIGRVRMLEELRFEGKLMGVTVSRTAGKWYASISVELEDLPESTNPSVVGIDVGIKSIAVASDGTVLDNPKLLRKYEAKLIKAQQLLSKKQARSHRQHKARLELQKIHQKITNIRTDAIHKFTTSCAKNHGLAVVETLDVKSMKETSDRWLRCLLQDTAMSEVHRQIKYKMRTVEAPQFYASSKTCSNCGAKKDILSLDTRIYKCNACKFECDRDLNASFNLKNMHWGTV